MSVGVQIRVRVRVRVMARVQYLGFQSMLREIAERSASPGAVGR